jgi:hypothetical protein
MGDAAAIEARVAEELGADAAGIAALARSISRLRAVSSNPATQPAPPAEITVDVAKADADKAGGTSSDIANAKIIREACFGLTEAAARETVELLKQLGPRDAREALTIRRLVALDALMVETVGLARAAHHPLLRDAYVTQACALSRAATALDEALERKRVGKPEQRIVVQHIHGGQVVGMVSKGEGSG